jgi:hypothetical protein
VFKGLNLKCQNPNNIYLKYEMIDAKFSSIVLLKNVPESKNIVTVLNIAIPMKKISCLECSVFDLLVDLRL